MFIISRCLLGVNCKYNGGNNLRDYVVEFCESHSHTSVCPESVCLKAPREPAELVEQENGSFRVLNKLGEDITAEFVKGASESVIQAEREAVRRGERIEGAVLKAKSPSCGVKQIYDGTFSGTLTPGYGFFAAMLLEEFEKWKRGDETAVDGVSFATGFCMMTEKDLEMGLERDLERDPEKGLEKNIEAE